MVSTARYTVGANLLPASLSETSVYVHIPFCSSRCNYCDFYFETGRSPRVMAAVLDRIIEEAEYFLAAMGHPRIPSIYFGGGTPSVVPPVLLEGFLDRFCSLLFPSGRPAGEERPEWTFEANPESVTPELVEVLARAGVSRISLGVQSFRDELLAALTRRADGRTVTKALTLLDDAARGRIPHLNIDLMTGIPGQSIPTLEADIERATEFHPDHFSLYSLTVEERTPLKQAVERGTARPVSPEGEESLWLAARDRLEAGGYEWYEISNFALPGCRSRHNSSYWRLDPYLGLGPGAVSTLPMRETDRDRAGGEPDGQAAPFRLTNPNLFVYASRIDRSWNHMVEPLSSRAFLFDHFLTGLRTSEGVSLGRLESIFDIDLRKVLSAQLEKWRRVGYLDEAMLDGEEKRLRLSPAARLLLDLRLIEVSEWIDSLALPPTPRWPPL